MNTVASARSTAALPWLTTALVAASVLIYFTPDAESWAALGRTQVRGGELWRCWTGHLVHFNASHLGWDAIVVAVAGGWAERVSPTRTRWFYVAAPPAISAGLLVCLPALATYGGLSALAVGLVALLGIERLQNGRTADRWLWGVVLGFAAAKVAGEFWLGRSTFADFSGTSVRSVPLAHALGFAAGGIAGAIRRRRRDTPLS